MEWNAKLDWAEEIYTMAVVLPVPVLFVALLWWLAPWLHRRRTRNGAVSEKTAGGKT